MNFPKIKKYFWTIIYLQAYSTYYKRKKTLASVSGVSAAFTLENEFTIEKWNIKTSKIYIYCDYIRLFAY